MVNDMTSTNHVDFNDGYYWVTDANLKMLLEQRNYTPYDEGISEYNGEFYWRFGKEVSGVIQAYNEEKMISRYSLDRWRL